ncbi:hypothetical protein HELRODRAFT_187953 [Helobdella robusta]|uniref:Uncharacterized protein n=1 Tax=Helobdella robusta TaxID=6412 RepID=T1FPI1_HELRO|nr:hypothetical protein HELRODRAFT_187953 [Helobdella robusta]ESO12680.1 hypothetical protein HELRODRAFT_187953 [Helobdella robusta]
MDGGKETPELDLCTNATVLDDDWRHPSEEDKKKCDNKLAINRWYKFRYQGASGLIAMGPIKENHCSTTGSLSIFRQSPNFQYPPPVNQSSIYTTCVHVKILGVVSCIDHMIIPVIALTCPNNDVIYYITRTTHICPSAFCVIGNDENVKPTTSKQQSDMNEITRKLKRIISESINNPGWRDNDCFQEHLNQLSEHTCIYRRLNKSSVFVARTVVDIIWTKALKFRLENDSTVGVYDKNINKSRQSSDMYDDDSRGLNISTHTDKSNATQTGDCAKENDTLFYVLMWLNWTGAIQNTTGSEVVKLYKGLPSDELPPLVLPSVSIYPNFFYCIFWPMCILLIVFAVLIIYYQVQCCNAFYLFQREKIVRILFL